MKTLVLTALILGVCAIGNIGTKRADAMSSLQHNLIVSKHKINWYHGKGQWTLYRGFKTCKAVKYKLNERQGNICYHARVTLERHTERYRRIWAILHPLPNGGYDWDSLVSKCEAPRAGWYANTGNGFYFGPQFTRRTWHVAGGPPVLEMDGYGQPMRSFSIDFIKHIGYNVTKLQAPSEAWPNCYGYL